jgi:transposase
VEVERPRRRERHAGKSDRIDALAAAKCVVGGENVSSPRSSGILSALRALLIARRSAVAERTRLLNQLQALSATAPVELRDRIGQGTGKPLERRLVWMREPTPSSKNAPCSASYATSQHAHARWQPTPNATSSS